MTLRSIIIGLLFGSFIAAFGYYNDFYLELTFLVGNHLPIIVFGSMILYMIVLDPLLRRIWRRLPLTRAELAVVLIMMLSACSVPGSGLMRLFTTVITVPIHREQSRPGWQKHEVLSYIPDQILPNHGVLDDEVVVGYVKGLNLRNDADERVLAGPEDIPWSGWTTVFTSWGPLIILCFIGVVGLSLVVHRQWSRHERLYYPIATVATLLMEREEGDWLARIYRNRLFWLGTGAVLFIHIVNGLYTWDIWQFEIETQFPLGGIVFRKYSSMNVPGASNAFFWRIYMTAVAFAYFLASDVSFSLGISQYVRVLFMIFLLEAGIEVTGGHIRTGSASWYSFGAFLGMALMVMYTGRRYYLQVFRQAFGGRSTDGSITPGGVWGARAFIAGAVGMVVVLTTIFEMYLLLAIALVLLVFLIYLVMARIVAETGLFFMQSNWIPLAVFAGFMGFESLGPTQFVVIALVSIILTGDPRECLMPFVVNGLKICENAKVPRGRAGGLAGLAVIVAFVVAIPAVLMYQYNLGLNNDDWAHSHVAETGLDQMTQAMTKAQASGVLSDVIATAEKGELGPINIDPEFIWFAVAGIGLVLACSFMRLRFPWWPLHPILFLVILGYPLSRMHFSFMLGWLIKTIVMRVGGTQVYRAGRPLMLGLIGGLIFNAAGIFVALTGGQPYPYNIFPG
jgi:hypothetical protein